MLAQQNAQLQRNLALVQNQLLDVRTRRDALKAQVRSLEGKLAAARREVDASLVTHATRTVMATRNLTHAQSLNLELREAMVSMEAESGDEERDLGQEVTELHGRLAVGTEAYSTLRSKYQRLAAAFTKLEAFTNPNIKRDVLVYRQWNRLCLRLYKATQGKPQSETDHEILSTWINWQNANKKTTRGN